MSKDTVRTRSRIVIEKYRKGELVERREVENATLTRVGFKIAFLVYGHDASIWNISDKVIVLALGDYYKNTIKAMADGTSSIREDTAARRWIYEVRWTDSTDQEYIVYHVALHDIAEYPDVGTSILAGAYHFATLPSPLSKARDDVIKYKWIVEIPYEVV